MTRSGQATTSAVRFKPSLRAALLCAAGALAGSTFAAHAQEGFPLDGTWRGEWGEAGRTTAVVIVMTWDGTTIGGLVNPGRSSARFSAASLNPSDWTVHFEAALPLPAAGAGAAATAATTPVVIDGKLDDLGSYHRTIKGTWKQAGVAHALTLTRE